MISEVSSANQELLRKYKREMNLRKKCHNELVRLKGPSTLTQLLTNVAYFCFCFEHHLILASSRLVRLPKGNIRVFCRVRPVSQEEQDSADAKTMLSFDSEDDAVLHLSSKGKVMSFELDKVFPPQATQEEVSSGSEQSWLRQDGHSPFSLHTSSSRTPPVFHQNSH